MRNGCLKVSRPKNLVHKAERIGEGTRAQYQWVETQLFWTQTLVFCRNSRSPSFSGKTLKNLDLDPTFS